MDIIEQLRDLVDRRQSIHQAVDYCPRGILPQYGGPQYCYECEDYDRVLALLRELEKQF